MKNSPSKFAVRWLYFATLLLVLAGVGNIHNHWCFDGQEPPLTVHFENFNNHTEHEEGIDIVDVESESIPGTLLVKNQTQDGQVFVLALSLLISLQAPQRLRHVDHADLIVPREPFSVLPPSRAPPAHSS